MSGKQSKGEVYAVALEEARRQGRWNDKISTPLASALPWSELVRKYAKHNPDRVITANAARAEQLCYVALNEADKTSRSGDETFSADVGFKSFPEAGPLRSNDFRRPQVAQMSQRDELRSASEALASSLSQGEKASKSNEENSGRLVLALTYYTLGDPDGCLEELGRCDSSLSNVASGSEGHETGLKIMGFCIAGRCHEMKNDFERAEASYASAAQGVSSHQSLLSEKTGTVAYWLEDSLYRLSMLSGYREDFEVAIPAHRAYYSLTSTRPSKQNPYKRSAFYRSYLAVLQDAYKANRYLPAHAQQGANSGRSSVAQIAWRAEQRQVERAYERIISATTSFPRAGLLNQPMLDFVDQVYASWEMGGRSAEDAPDAIEIHYRAIERTFHSQRIMRHLVHLLTAVGNYDDAERTLRLYNDLFSKAKETDARQIAKEVLAYYEKSGDPIEGGKGANQPDFDTDDQYVETIAFGVRMLCKQAREVAWAVELADGLESYAKENAEHLALVEYTRGLARAILAHHLADADSRSKDQEQALKHLQKAVELEPESVDKRYLLGHLQTEMRDIPNATATIRQTVAIDSERPEVWHLLVLLTSATRDYEGALKIADLALDSNDVDGDSVSEGVDGTGGFATPAEAATPNLAGGKGGIGSIAGSGPTDLVDQQASAYSHLPPPVGTQHRPHINGESGTPMLNGSTSSTKPMGPTLTSATLKQSLQQPAGGIPPRASSIGTARPDDMGGDVVPADADALEAELQLRITRNALVEIIEGPEAALQDQQSLFSLFAQISPRLASASSHATATSGTGALHSTVSPLVGETRHASTAAHGGVSRSASLSQPGSTLPRGVAASRAIPDTSSPPDADIGRDTLASVNGDMSSLKTTRAAEQPIAEAHSARARALLVKLWLLSASTFRRWGKYEEGRAAIEAAETLDPEDSQVWVQLALYDLAVGDASAANTALTKALALDPRDQIAMTELGKLHIAQGELALAEAALEEATNGRGWANGAAWRALGSVCARTERTARARRCLEYALTLESSRPVRHLDDAVPRIL